MIYCLISSRKLTHIELKFTIWRVIFIEENNQIDKQKKR